VAFNASCRLVYASTHDVPLLAPVALASTYTTHPGSIVHVGEQPSFGARLPSSHVSPAATLVRPSEQSGAVQSGSQSGAAPPRSQTSPLSRTPSPHLGKIHDVRQAFGTVSLLAGPLSHCSPLSRTESPQRCRVQFARHASGVVS